ncbi:hypothetical protein K7X08_018159 [Anisodus acutangulus]|uniref:F-box domain-containing protein n=1 Tax=Anisodus acutangulus TaxID=402998 RepID=A0A9Q1LX75_9SOLA|nr:hypothetical protein K7X08_018159 [Anisodus acutangulus]
MVDSKSRKSSEKRWLPTFSNLTDELLNEILIRLPNSKEAIRCKLVCKRWFSLISSDYFVTTFVVHNRDKDKTILPFNLVLHDQKNNQVEYVECRHPKRGSSSRVDLGFLPARFDQICLEASCGDLILCSAARSYCIFNILNRQWIILPANYCPIKSGIGFLVEPNCVDNARHEYQVLQYWCVDNSRINIEIFSSQQGRWTRLVVTSLRRLINLKSNTSLIACGRMLYGLTYNISVRADFVMAFDPFTNDPAQILHIVDLPLEARDSCGFLSSNVGVCQGSLRFAQVTIQTSPYPCISIWELEDCRMGIWTLVHKRIPIITALRVPTLRADTTNMFSVLAFHPDNEDLICFRVGRDGTVFYFHGKKDEHFSLISDFNVQINVRFIGLPPTGRTRDFTWIEALGLMFGSHNFTLEATMAENWDQEADHLKFTYDGMTFNVPIGHPSVWDSPDQNLELERTSATNSKWNSDSLSPKVEGILGSTYQPNFKNPAKSGVDMAVIGGDDKYKTSSLLSDDCNTCTVFTPGKVVAERDLPMDYGSLDCTGGNGIVCKK